MHGMQEWRQLTVDLLPKVVSEDGQAGSIQSVADMLDKGWFVLWVACSSIRCGETHDLFSHSGNTI